MSDRQMLGRRKQVMKPRPLVETVNALELEEFKKQYWSDDLVHNVHASISGNASRGFDASKRAKLMGGHTKLQLATASSIDHEKLSACFSLVETLNREDYEASSWGWHPAKKRAEMQLPDLKYILLWEDSAPGLPESTHQVSNHVFGKSDAKETIEKNMDSMDGNSSSGDKRLLAFISFMVTYEDAREVIYIYEIHVSPSIQGYGLGPRLILLVEELGRRIGLEKAMLTVFRRNVRAKTVYERKLGWQVDEFSPEPRKMRGGRVKESDYIIMSKKLKP